MESTLKFQRGDIYFIRLDNSTGSEQSGTRPAVILQNDVGNTYSPTLIVATLTSKTEKKAAQPTHCLVEPEKLEPSIVQAEQIFTIDKSRVQNFVGHLTPEEMSRVDDAVKISLALNPMGSMFDRIGRIADETPFVVEWFVRNGIRVWSTQEGEQRFDNHTDKLLNYIRFWQADGESEKTSVRTRTSLRQLVEEGHFKGGNAPYGYDLVRSGRINKRKHELYELHINEQEAAVVRIVFDKYVYEGYGPQHIATYLNNSGYRARSGKCWHPSSIRGMVQNLTYTGVLRCGDARSELMPDLQIVPQEQFENAQRIRNERSVRSTAEAENRLPLNIHGKSLLAGNAYCGHCGAKLELTSSRKWRKMADGSLDDTLRIRYTCYGKLRKQTNCTGQTGYTVHILDEIIDKAVRQIFSKMRGIPKEQIVTKRYEKETTERKNHLQDLQTQRDKAEKDLLSLKAEILACIKGESVLPRETLAEMITEQEEKLKELEDLCESASEELERTAELMDKVSRLYDELISYADLYDSANFEAKKMVVNQLIRRVDVYRGYQINISFNFDLTPYIEGE